MSALPYLQEFAFSHLNNRGVMPAGMFSSKSRGYGKHLFSLDAIGGHEGKAIVLSINERPAQRALRREVGRSAVIHILTPSEGNLIPTLALADYLDTLSLVFTEKHTDGLVASHEAHIPLGWNSRHDAILNYIGEMSEPKEEAVNRLYGSPDLVDLDWREANDYDHDFFAEVISRMIAAKQRASTV